MRASITVRLSMTSVSRRAGPGVGGTGDNDFVFGECFFGDEGTGKVQLARGVVVGVLAEAAHVGDDVVDLVIGNEIAEGRHDLRQAAGRSAVDDGGLPVAVGLGRCSGAIGEVRPGIGAPNTVLDSGAPLPSLP